MFLLVDLNFTLDILELMVKRKKVFGFFIGSSEIYKRYSGVDDEQQKKSLRFFIDSFEF